LIRRDNLPGSLFRLRFVLGFHDQLYSGFEADGEAADGAFDISQG
jgi:hypothetical protein